MDPKSTSRTHNSPTRGDATRAALVEAAIVVFGRDGFDAASTRALAEAAGVNQALIGYHFGGKEGLYHAVFEHIAERVGERMGPMAAAIREQLGQLEDAPEAARNEGCLALLHHLTDAFVVLLTSEESTSWSRLILREQQAPTAAFEILYEGMMRRMLEILTRLVSRCRGLEEDARETRLIAFTVLGQVLGFRAARTTLARFLGWESLSEEDVMLIQETIRRNTTAILTPTSIEG